MERIQQTIGLFYGGQYFVIVYRTSVRVKGLLINV